MMKPLILLTLAAIGAAAADPVAVTINGRDYTRAEFEQLMRNIGGNIPAQFNSNRQGFLDMFALTQRFAEEARKLKVHELEPYKSRIAYNEMMQLAQYVLDVKNREAKILPEHQRAYYDKNPNKYSAAKIKVLYLAFTNTALPGAAGGRTEADAQALAARLKAQLSKGADFVKLVREYSDDPDSKSKDGDFPDIKPSDSSLPTNITQAVFALKPGEISEPIRQPNGYYLFRLEQMIQQPFEQVRDDIYIELQKEFLDQWVEGVRKSVQVEVKDESFLQGQAQP